MFKNTKIKMYGIAMIAVVVLKSKIVTCRFKTTTMEDANVFV